MLENIPARLRTKLEKERFKVFKQQQDGAKRRDISWMLTFEQWWQIWSESGYWMERGSYGGQYVMSRYGDKGPYAVGNVFIQTCNENSREATKLKKKRPRHNYPTRDWARLYATWPRKK